MTGRDSTGPAGCEALQLHRSGAEAVTSAATVNTESPAIMMRVGGREHGEGEDAGRAASRRWPAPDPSPVTRR